MKENPAYLGEQLVTCIGNKRALLDRIEPLVLRVKKRLGKRKLRALDAFAGSGVVSRLLKRHCKFLASNDMEYYAAAVGKCFLANACDVDRDGLAETAADLNARVNDRFSKGFVEETYAPEDDENVRPGERCFYTRDNARRLDNYRRMLGYLPERTRDLLLGPLLSEASVHVNTSGVFKGFHKDRRTGVGKFGGTNGDALSRIKGRIELRAPVLSRFDCETRVTRMDAGYAALEFGDLDLAYLDPPYNQHPYGSNYFMLNLLTTYERPREVSRVSGIPKNWFRSKYNSRRRFKETFAAMTCRLDAKFLLVSFNDEGFVTPDEMEGMLKRYGKVESVSGEYATFRGCRNLGDRGKTVHEWLFLVERK